jgi:hypothetical protein
MTTAKLTLIFASLALALAWAVTASAANAAEMQPQSAWCGGQQSGSHSPHGYGSNC